MIGLLETSSIRRTQKSYRERGSTMCSSPAEAPTESAIPPNQREEAPEHSPKSPSWTERRLRSVLFVAVLALPLVGALFMVARYKRTHSASSRSHSSSLPADSDRTLRLKGTTEAVDARAILAPVLAGQEFSTLTITGMARNGSHVRRGDLLAEFDRQAQLRDFVDKQSQYRSLADQVLEEQARENAARAKDETEIKQAEDDLSKAQLEMQKVELLSRIDAEKARQDLDQATATLRQLRETFDLKRRAAQAAVRILEIQRDRTRETMEHAHANSDLMQVHSPIDGVVVLTTIWKQGRMGEVQEGDQIRAGVSFMQVIDPSGMEVRALVNQEDFLSLQVGQTAKVYLDAYPELVFPGKLEETAPLARNGDFSTKLRTFTVVFSISGSDAKLMPDLSAAVDVDLAAQGSAEGGFR